MLDGIDALVALDAFGTVSEAATRLRLTQSAVSKRLIVLEAEVGFRLVERDGRRLRLTARAIDFLERARPLVAELRGLAGRPPPEGGRTRFSIALADSIASSWGPKVIRRVLDASPSPGLELVLHAHRSVLVIESVRLGRYDVGVCTASLATGAKDLVTHPLVEEPMVVVTSGLGSRFDRSLPLVSIEPTSATWRAIEPALRAKQAPLLARAAAIVAVESFGAVVQMARAGFGNGLVPLGLARDARLPRRAVRPLEGVTRRVALLTRKTTSQSPAFASLRASLESAAQSVVRE